MTPSREPGSKGLRQTAKAPKRKWFEQWVGRLEAELNGLEGPLVQIWAWPGSGKRALLAELVTRGGMEIPPVALRDAGLLRRVAREARQRECPWLLCRQWPHAADPVVPGPILDELTGRPLLVFSSHLRRPLDSSSSSTLEPRSLLLESSEVAGLWHELTGERPAPAQVSGLIEVCHGWLQPLRLAAVATSRGHQVSADPASWLALPEMVEFLRQEVFDGIPLGTVEPDGFLKGELRARGMAVFDPASKVYREPKLVGAFFQLPREVLRRDRPEAVPPSVPPGTSLEEDSEGGGTGPTFEVRLFGTPLVTRLPSASRGAETGDSLGTNLGEASPVEIRWQLRRAFKIFAFLASCKGYQAVREDLIEAVFPDEDPASIKRNFHPTLSYLRRNLLGGSGTPRVVEHRHGTYRLNPKVVWNIDSERFEDLATKAAQKKSAGELETCAVLARQAWGLYRGPFLHGIYDSWAVERRESLQRSYLRLLRDLGEASEALGRLTEALDAYRAVLVEDPLQEGLQVATMGIYAALGRRDLVRRQYDRLNGLLMEELGVEPLASTTAEYHRLMG
ncbi:MAG: bacterial transcriptional activator domain-containing protein [Deltaproteobacteria bacterium]|nr:bacterial transcriptional activator domain-containing protein [Deltaproteobacteria bacterium]